MILWCPILRWVCTLSRRFRVLIHREAISWRKAACHCRRTQQSLMRKKMIRKDQWISRTTRYLIDKSPTTIDQASVLKRWLQTKMSKWKSLWETSNYVMMSLMKTCHTCRKHQAWSSMNSSKSGISHKITSNTTRSTRMQLDSTTTDSAISKKWKRLPHLKTTK